MSDILFQYHRVQPTTWVYLSSLLTIGLFFKFSRFWSVRNLDLLLLISFAPGLLLVEFGSSHDRLQIEQAGYLWLFAVTGVFLIRMLLDPMMVRRPLLEPNLSVGGMTFIGVALFAFLMANVINSKVTRDDVAMLRAAQATNPPDSAAASGAGQGDKTAVRSAGYPMLFWLPRIPTQVFAPKADAPPTVQSSDVVAIAASRTIAILSHLAIVSGMILIGYRHFDNIRTGIAAAMLYLLLPYTAQLTGAWDHVLPAAMLVWALEAYRRPFIAGAFMGIAIGVTFYPIFLLPLWLAFYWQRGLLRFGGGVLSAVLVLALLLIFVSDSMATYVLHLKQMFGWSAIAGTGTEGFWSFGLLAPVWRIPVLAAFIVMCASFALWPPQKNLGTLMSCSAAVMLATQFWHTSGGGMYMAWFLPLLLLTIFRPNLEDRVALSVLGEGWLGRRRPGLNGAERAA